MLLCGLKGARGLMLLWGLHGVEGGLGVSHADSAATCRSTWWAIEVGREAGEGLPEGGD